MITLTTIVLVKRFSQFTRNRLLNRLWVRLSLAFVLVALLSVSMIATFGETSVSTGFQQYVYVSSVNNTSRALSAYFTQTGSWNGVGRVLTLLAKPGQPLPAIQSQTALPPPFILADAHGVVVYDSAHGDLGVSLTGDQLKQAIPLASDNIQNQIFGYMLPHESEAAVPLPKFPLPPGSTPQTVEAQFLNGVVTTLSIAAILIGVLGILAGLLLSRMLIAPLNQLEYAARAFARRDWTYRIKHQGIRELAAAATAFNHMADELQRAETLRRNLVADVAHELRTPLTVMQANLMAILDGVYPLDKREIATLYEETCTLNRLVNDLRELAQADAGQLELCLTRVSVWSILESTAAKFTVAAEADGTQVQALPCTPDWTIYADTARISQVLGNLLANALRHTLGGNVSLSAEKLSAANEPARIRITVTDNGEGIPVADVPHVFDRFYRVDKSRARSSGNSGLGLAIAKAWIEAMGGSIGVESVYRKGSRFWFTLPLSG